MESNHESDKSWSGWLAEAPEHGAIVVTVQFRPWLGLCEFRLVWRTDDLTWGGIEGYMHHAGEYPGDGHWLGARGPGATVTCVGLITGEDHDG